MTPLPPTQPFGSSINPFGREFRDMLNALGETVAQLRDKIDRAETLTSIIRNEIPKMAWAVGRITARSADINANYHAQPVWGAPLVATDVTPLMRTFDTKVVDAEAAEVGDPCFLFTDNQGEVHLIVWTEIWDLVDCNAPPKMPEKTPSVMREQKYPVQPELDFHTAAAASAFGISQFAGAT